MDLQSRVLSYYKGNLFIQKYLKAIDTKTNEVVLDFNGEKRININDLENIKSEEGLNAFFNRSAISSGVEPLVSQPSIDNEKLSSNPVITPVAKEQTMLVDNIDLKKETLNDIKILTELKNKEGLDNLLKKFSINSSTGLIDVNMAISTVTKNTMNEVEKAIKNNYQFNTDFSQYDIEGNYIGTPIMGLVSEDEQIAKSFNNIKLYLDASKMYPEQANYNDEQISNFMKTYISKVKEELHGPANVIPAASPEPVEMVEEPVMTTPQVSNNNESQVSPSAGFADIFVLSVIVLVYAAIIVNLVLKLN